MNLVLYEINISVSLEHYTFNDSVSITDPFNLVLKPVSANYHFKRWLLE